MIFIGIIIVAFMIKAIRANFIEEHSNPHYPYNVRSIPVKPEFKDDNQIQNGFQLNQYCSRCGYQIDPDANYCPMCGSDLRELNY